MLLARRNLLRDRTRFLLSVLGRAKLDGVIQMHVAIPIGGLRCPTVTGSLERDLARAPGVLEVVVNPVTDLVHIRFDPAVTGPDRLRRAVGRQGYRVGRPVDG
jgi:copper chaperone CopZ